MGCWGGGEYNVRQTWLYRHSLFAWWVKPWKSPCLALILRLHIFIVVFAQGVVRLIVVILTR